MLPEEIEELQEYLKQYKINKKIRTMPTQDFYVAEKNGSDPAEFVSLDENDEVTFTTVLNEAEWSFSETTVQTFINRYEIEGVKPKKQTGANHPPKPPL